MIIFPTEGGRRIMWRKVGARVALTLLVGGCGAGNAQPPTPDAGADAGCPPGSGRPPGGPPTGNVIGSWAGLQVAFTHVNNISNEQISRSMYLYEQSDLGGGDLAVTEKVCDLEIDDEAGL